MATYVAIDYETTGLCAARHSIVQIGAVVLDPRTLANIASLRLHVWPEPAAQFDPEAMEYNGYDAAEWRKHGALEMPEALRHLRGWLRNFSDASVPIAHNAARLEIPFTAAACERYEITLPLDHHWLCTCSAFFMWRRLAGLHGSCNLATLALLSGHWTEEQEREQHHDALADAEACAAGWRWLNANMAAAAAPKPAVQMAPGQILHVDVERIPMRIGAVRHNSSRPDDPDSWDVYLGSPADPDAPWLTVYRDQIGRAPQVGDVLDVRPPRALRIRSAQELRHAR